MLRGEIGGKNKGASLLGKVYIEVGPFSDTP